MEEIDQNIGEHGIDPVENRAVNFSIEQGMEYAVDHSVDNADDVENPGGDYAVYDQSVDNPADQAIDDGINQELDHDTDRGEVIEHNLEHAIDQDAEHDLDQNVDHTVGNDMDHPEDQVPENFQAQEKHGHGEDTVAGDGEKKWPGWPGDSVFRMLVPAQKVGSIIGRKGEFIKKIVEETRARIKILDGPPGTKERAVMVSAKEEPDSSLPPAIDGLLRVHKRVVDGLEGDPSQVSSNKVSTRFLLPASQAGSLIGKQGATVKSIQEESGCVVRVLGSEELPVFALQDDRVVELVGDPAAVHKAVELIASHLRKFLVDHGIISVFEMQMQASNQRMEQHIPPHQSWGPPQVFPPNAGGGPGFVPNRQYMPSQRQNENYYPPTEMPLPMENKPHQGISAYGREAPVSVHTSQNSLVAPSVITQVTQQMQIPLSYADAVIGAGGATISYIRRISGATVTIQESRGAPGEMTVEISGTASQVQTAQQLIQNYMAEAGGATQAQAQAGGATEQGYNPYGSVYGSDPGHAGGYGSVYGASYGY